jgi:hypothetical protein
MNFRYVLTATDLPWDRPRGCFVQRSPCLGSDTSDLRAVPSRKRVRFTIVASRARGGRSRPVPGMQVYQAVDSTVVDHVEGCLRQHKAKGSYAVSSMVRRSIGGQFHRLALVYTYLDERHAQSAIPLFCSFTMDSQPSITAFPTPILGFRSIAVQWNAQIAIP